MRWLATEVAEEEVVTVEVVEAVVVDAADIVARTMRLWAVAAGGKSLIFFEKKTAALELFSSFRDASFSSSGIESQFRCLRQRRPCLSAGIRGFGSVHY